MQPTMDEKNLLKLLFELGVLSRTPRTGPYHVGITNQQTAAAHSYRVSVLAYFLGVRERADTAKILKMCMIHDMPEARLLNQTFIQKAFYSVNDKAVSALSKQLRNLEGSQELEILFSELTACQTKEAKIVHDANALEALVEAKEYMQQGVTIMERWFLDKRKGLMLETSKKIFDILEKETIHWWTDK